MTFVSLEVQAVKEIGNDCMIVSDDAEADFFSLYGKDELGFAYCIGDFNSRASAETIRSAIKIDH